MKAPLVCVGEYQLWGNSGSSVSVANAAAKLHNLSVKLRFNFQRRLYKPLSVGVSV